jgi:hypothetical protein
MKRNADIGVFMNLSIISRLRHIGTGELLAWLPAAIASRKTEAGGVMTENRILKPDFRYLTSDFGNSLSKTNPANTINPTNAIN